LAHPGRGGHAPPSARNTKVAMRILQKVRELVWRLSMRGLRRGPRITRYFMYERLRAVGTLLPHRTGCVLAISHSANLCGLLSLKPTAVVEANYPEHSILHLDYPDASFDHVLSDQVLEHVEGSPQQAIDECHRVLRRGGIAVHTTCLLHPIHGAPEDFWRFTPQGLSLLHRAWTRVIEVGSWGNREVWPIVGDEGDGLRYEGVPHARWHPFHRLATRNDPRWPIVTWIIAVK